MQKVIAPAAINALKEALTAIYWYKSDLRSFLIQTLGNSSLLTQVNWEDYKRNIVATLVEHMARNQERHQEALLRLMREVCRVQDYAHLRRLEDGEEKASVAKAAVDALRKLMLTHESIIQEQEEAEKRRQATYQSLLRVHEVRQKVELLCQEFYKMVSTADPQQRGYILEKVLRDLFGLFDLDPKASFRLTGEQIDGAFTFEKTEYLLEARWRQQPSDAQDLDAFHGKVGRKLDNTLGLFLSINGFAKTAIDTHTSGSRRMILLMDGSHLMAILEGRIDLIELLLRMRRHAAITGDIYLPIERVLTATSS